MTGYRAAAAVATVLAAVLLGGCTRTSDGTPVAAGAGAATEPGATSGHPDFGVLPSTGNAPAPAGTVTCAPERRPTIGLVAKVADPGAPVVTVAVPDGWGMQGGSGDVGAQLKGPDDMSAVVRIVATGPDPQQSFAEYADELTAGSGVSALSVLPAELCDYSGQKLLGTLADGAQPATEFVDRIVHVRTRGGDYLIAVHAEAPAGSSDFDSAATQLTEDFEVKMP